MFPNSVEDFWKIPKSWFTREAGRLKLSTCSSYVKVRKCLCDITRSWVPVQAHLDRLKTNIHKAANPETSCIVTRYFFYNLLVSMLTELFALPSTSHTPVIQTNPTPFLNRLSFLLTDILPTLQKLCLQRRWGWCLSGPGLLVGKYRKLESKRVRMGGASF